MTLREWKETVGVLKDCKFVFFVLIVIEIAKKCQILPFCITSLSFMPKLVKANNVEF